MKSKIKKILVSFFFAVLCVLAGFLIGNYSQGGEMVETVVTEQTPVVSEPEPKINFKDTIAIVNLDEGLNQGGNIINYGNSLVSALDRDVRVTGLQDARNGIENGTYIQLDYVTCIDSMEKISPEDMDISTKYILAVSYAKCESLKKEEMESIISKLSLMSNPKELEYWIYLGRMEYATAQELAQALSDDQLLVYAYMKELDRLESDTSMNGEEKQERIKTLQDKIIQLGEKYTPEEEK